MDAAGIDRQLATTRTAIARGWATALHQLRAANPAAELADRIRARVHPDTLITGLDAAFAGFAAAERDAYLAAGRAEARFAAGEVEKHHTDAVPTVQPSGRPAVQVAKKLLAFDDADPDVLSWAERNRLDLVRDLTFEQRSLIRAMLIRIDEDGTNPLEAARDILDSLGLTPAQNAAVESYGRSLLAGDYTAALDRALSSGNADRVIAAARAGRRQLTVAQIDRAVLQYRANYVRLRAETIARTESQRIAHQGSDALYRQAIRRGDIDADQVECEWLHHPGKKSSKYDRQFHIVMHGQQRPWGEPFVSGLGNELLFPGDPAAPAKETVNCACGRTVRLRPAAALRRAA